MNMKTENKCQRKNKIKQNRYDRLQQRRFVSQYLANN